MRIEDDDDRLVLICAFRYALGRMTYMPGVIAGAILQVWDDLTKADQQLFHREITEAFDRGMAGMGCDMDTWTSVLALPVKER